MSHVFEALKQAELERGGKAPEAVELGELATGLLQEQEIPTDRTWLDETAVVTAAPAADSRLIALTGGDTLGAEKFRLLRARLRHLREKRQLNRVAITSGVPDDGKTLVACNLAVSLASHNAEKVLLLEGDLRKPTVGTQFGLKDLKGISEWAQEEAPLSDFIYRLENSGLFLLTAGKPADDALKILHSSRFLEALAQIAGSFDWIIIDTPPLAPVADAHFWSRHADGVLLVVRQGRTPKTVLQKGLETLDGTSLLGVVLNDAPGAEHSYYYKYYDRGSRVLNNPPEASANGQ